MRVVVNSDFPYPEAIPEGRYKQFDVTLPSYPTAPVHITFADLSSLTSTTPSLLTFNSSNWKLPQTLTVSAPEDRHAQAGIQQAEISFSFSSEDDNYNDISVKPLSVQVEDNDGGMSSRLLLSSLLVLAAHDFIL